MILTCKSFDILVKETKDKPHHLVADSLGTAEDEQLHQVKRMIRRYGNMFVSVQCSERQSGEKFKTSADKRQDKP